MNLSPDWCEILRGHGWEAVHWFEVGAPTASDTDVMSYARRSVFVTVPFPFDEEYSRALVGRAGEAWTMVSSAR